MDIKEAEAERENKKPPYDTRKWKGRSKTRREKRKEKREKRKEKREKGKARECCAF